MEENKSAAAEPERTGEEQLNETETVFCPWCGKRVPAESVYCEFCGKYVPDGEEPGKMEDLGTESSGTEPAGAVWGSIKKFLSGRNRKWLAGGAAVLVLLLIWIAVSGGGTSPEEAEVFYIKDNSLYGFAASGTTGESREYSAEYLEKWGSRPSGGILPGRGIRKAGMPTGTLAEELIESAAPACSESGRFLFYPSEGAKGSFDLCRTDLKKNETKTLDGGVVSFVPVGEGQVIYRKENGSLFYYDASRKSRLALKADDCQVSWNGDALIWTTEEDGVRDIYYQRLDGGEKLRIERNAKLLDASPDLNSILVQKEDEIYIIRGQEEKEKAAGEAVGTAGVNAESETFYFVRNVDRTPSTSYQELCYYVDGKTSMIDDSLKEILWQQGGVLLYTRTEDGENGAVAVDGKTVELSRTPVLPGKILLDGDLLYFLSPGESTGESKGEKQSREYELCRVRLGDREPGHAETVDTGVSETACASDGSVYYFKDMTDGIGDLYCDGELIAYDAASGSVAAALSGSEVYCIADCIRSKRRGTLMLTDPAGGRNIADDVAAYSVSDDGGVLMLTEYNRDKGRGNLMHYDGTENRLVDTDVWGFYEPGTGGNSGKFGE